MKPIFTFSLLILSALVGNSQNMNVQQFAVNNVQTNINYNLSNIDINENNTHNRGRSSSALDNLGNTGNINNPQKKVNQVQQTIKPKNKVNNSSVNNLNRGNILDVNDNVDDINFTGTNITNVYINTNPIALDNPNKVADKPKIKEYEGLDFKPSGLSGRDYSNGGKLKKGEKNINKPNYAKPKTIHRKKPSFKKIKYHTSKCAKW